MNRSLWAMAAAAVVVIAAIVLGFRTLGSPAQQRRIRQDRRTVAAMSGLAGEIRHTWRTSDHVLPPNLEEFRAEDREDPTTHRPFKYRSKATSRFELCGVFLTDDREPQNADESPSWSHPKGEYCFDLDAATPNAMPFFNY